MKWGFLRVFRGVCRDPERRGGLPVAAHGQGVPLEDEL